MLYKKLENIQDTLFETGEISEESLSVVYQTLFKKDLLSVTIACAILTGQKEDKIDEILEKFYTFPKLTKKIMIPHLASTAYYKAIKFLFEFLDNTRIPELIATTAMSLGKADYPVIPYVLDFLEKSDPAYQEKLLIIIEIIGFEQFKAPLSVLPYIPQEHIFVRAFGDKNIALIKNKKQYN